MSDDTEMITHDVIVIAQFIMRYLRLSEGTAEFKLDWE